MARKKLQGQVAIVTGGSRGLGRAAAELLAAMGASVVVTARSEETVNAVAESLRSQGARAIGVAADVADPEQVEEVVESALEQFSRVDILVNNAAVIWPVEEVADTDPDEWTYNIQVNLLGPFYLLRNVLPVMVEQHYGRIVNVSSGAAVNPIVGASAYSTAKAGMDMLTRATALELVDSGISITSLHPGMLDTDMQGDLRSVDTSESPFDLTRFHEAFEKGALRSPTDVARAVVWLAGPWAKAVSGRIFTVNDEEWLRQVNADLGV
jgi:NAD(P)-dependent dehydrogenase (short-subunit alcohol dehydrogenase family)